MSKSKGKIFADANWRQDSGGVTVEAYVRLYNFDVDRAELKAEHAEFLYKQLAFDLEDNKEARAFLMGSASKSGESDHNYHLSGRRAEAVQNFLLSKKVPASRFVPNSPIALGEDYSRSKLEEDERDRAVILLISFPVTIEEIALHTDDWRKSLTWDDVIGLDVADGSAGINKINIEVTARGALRFWEVNGRRVPVMPPQVEVRLTSRGQLQFAASASKGTIPTPLKWAVPLSQPEPTYAELKVRTKYRLSRPISSAGNFLESSYKVPGEVATVARHGGTSDERFRVALGGTKRGMANQPPDLRRNYSDESSEKPDPLRLLHAGGVEVLLVEALGRGDPKKTATRRLIRNPADVFYYTGLGREDGWLAIGSNQWGSPKDQKWASPQDLQRYWKSWIDVDVLILAASTVLKMNVSGGVAGGDPKAEWAKLLKNKGGPLSAILGYRGGAPADDPVGNAIASKMAEKIATGLEAYQWVATWLEINADHKAYNAVGMDPRGYSWIYERGVADRAFGLQDTFSPFVDYVIKGPVPINV